MSQFRRVINGPRFRAALLLTLALGAVAALIVTADPAHVGKTFTRFNLAYLPLALGLSLGFYALQGVRWWTLNRALGIRFPLGDTIFIAESGQATAMLPLGELTRALLLSRAANIGFGTAVATETVQELIFVFMLFVVALPKAVALHFIAIAVIVPILIIVAIVLVLTVERLYQAVRRVVVRVPGLRRLTSSVDQLHRDTKVLFRHRATYTWLPVSIAQALMAGSLLWVVAQAVAPGKLSWTSAGFVYAITQGASWLSLSPGGLGAVEASTAGLLVALGFSYDVAAAVSILQRLADKGLNTAIGLVCFWIARRRYHLPGASVFRIATDELAATPVTG